MIRSTILIAVFLAPIGTISAQDAPARCETEPGQAFVGQTASSESGAAIMAATGATVFQWVFENSAVTMDFRQERVRVTYNREMKIIAVTCG